MTEHQAKEHAARYVRQLARTGYDSAKARAELCLGFGAPRQPGFQIRSGKIAVPGVGSDRFVFRFEDIERMNRPLVQLELEFTHAPRKKATRRQLLLL